MKAFGILDYPVEDVFHIFVKNAKKDFSDFNEDDATGCKIQKSINSEGPKPIECTIEITKYVKMKYMKLQHQQVFQNVYQHIILKDKRMVQLN